MEAGAIKLGMVNRRTGGYASNDAVQRRRQQLARNAAGLASALYKNEAGQIYTLAELAAASVSNPVNRGGELMTRIRGCEEYADAQGHIGLFVTLTSPSAMHPMLSREWRDRGIAGAAADDAGETITDVYRAVKNPRYDGVSTPRDAQTWLVKQFGRARAAMKRVGLQPYGFRVAEPHHDATPHWHMLLWVKTEAEAQQLQDLLYKYWVNNDKRYQNERGAAKNRTNFKRLTAGGAAGYIAKYIAKNIDGLTEAGENVGLDFASGGKASDTAPRVRTWASVWGIRQFQQVGGPSVTVYRELRRLGEVDRATTPDLFAGPQDAADQGDYAMFWSLQGGPDVRRKDLTLSPAYKSDTVGKYGDPVDRVAGVNAISGEYLETRLHTWTVQRAGLAVVNVLQAEHSEQVRTDADVTRFLSEAKGFGIDFADAGRAWTGVNNCTVLPEKEAFMGFDFTGFEPETVEIGHWLDYSDGIAPWIRDGFLYKQPKFRADPADVAAEVRILDQATQKERELWEHQHKKPTACAR